MAEKFTEFDLPRNSYASFDATTLKQLIIDRLNEGGVFTDQNFEGSNLSTQIDIIAYAYHVLLFYLNRSGSETMFSQAQLFENMNRIVKLIGYNPTGFQTPLLAFNASATSDLDPGLHTIQRYSFFQIDGVPYSFTRDITFNKTTTAEEELPNIGDNNLLFQGKYVEHPLYTAIGEDFEVVTLTIVDNVSQALTLIDHFSLNVYVRDVNTQRWTQWEQTESLFLEGPTAEKFELRLNENNRYEIKAGDNVNGKRLNAGDTVAIYYLRSDGIPGQVGPGTLNGKQMFFFNSGQLSQILTDINTTDANYLSLNESATLSFVNEDGSTEATGGETTEQIRQNAPKVLRSQNKLIGTQDYQTFIERNFSNIVSSTFVVDNTQFLQTNGHFDYLYNVSINQPNDDARILFNQVNFADTCDFNNVYMYLVPKVVAVRDDNTPNFVTTAQKQLIVNRMQNSKSTSSEPVPMDPVYIAFDVGVQLASEGTLNSSIVDETTLEIVRDQQSRRNQDSIKQDVSEAFKSFFGQVNNTLGQLVNFNDLSNTLLNIDGVESFRTVRTSNGARTVLQGLSFVFFNPVYPSQDVEITNQNVQLPYFKFPYLNNAATFENKIVVVDA